DDKSNWQTIPKLTYRVNQYSPYPEDEIVRFTLSHEFNLTAEDLNQKREGLSIFFPFICNVYEIYLNGEYIGGKGKFENGEIVENGVMTTLVEPLPSFLLKEGKNELRIILTGYRNEEIGIYGDTDTEIDYYKNQLDQHSDVTSFALIFVYLFVGAYHFLLFFKRPGEKHNLFFACLSSIIGFYYYTRTIHINTLGLEYLIQYKIELFFLFHTAVFLLFFFETFFANRLTKFSKIYFGLVWLGILIMLFTGRAIMTKVLLAFQLTSFPMLGYITFLMVKALRNNHLDVKSLLIGFLIMTITISIDMVGAMHLIDGFENPGLTRFGFFSFVMGIAVVLANRFLRVHNEVEELNVNLEKKVEIRTKELKESLDYVQKLKTQQDGDYFLTTLLIKPLMLNEAISERVQIDFFIKQKKAFEFRKKQYEIGGDISISNNIKLKGKEYLAFVNADAMGKSIQGAGGALVLGVVFRSIITRTRSINYDKFPEQWLKSCFIELQNVFTSFDGSMLISAVLGLIDESNGTTYFINAEHPWIVLYRDGKSSFLEDSLSLRKIGMTGLDSSLKVGVFKMKAGDSILIGSDGRDDILLSDKDEEERRINEDETLFLRSVEYGKGDVEQIAKCIKGIGELTDDLTLVKVSYLPPSTEEVRVEDEEKYYDLLGKANAFIEQKKLTGAVQMLEAAFEMKPDDREVIKKIIHLMFALKMYDKTIYYCSVYLELEPSDSEHMFILASANKLSNNLVEAIDLGESLRLRDPLNVKNLINLSDSYRLAKNLDRANKILIMALEIEPDNEKAAKLRSILESN
ncbi:MAG: SpoIIE family protein phosphatase, partial [Leptospiraceae bacterium]|nr:SpoIIE family protein phosphatase [Leptospiraceae bacterium]